MAGPSNTSGFSALLSPEIWRTVEETGQEEELVYPQFMNEIDMPWRTIKAQQVAGLGPVPSKPEGAVFATDAPVVEGTKTATPVAYGLAIIFTWEAWEDELYGVFHSMAAELARSSRYRMEVDAHQVLNNAFSTSFVGFTAGEALCSNSHASPATSTTQSNRPSPDIGFSVAGLQAAMESFYTLLNDRDLPQALFPSLVIIHPNNIFAAREILGSSGTPGSANNDYNSLESDGLRWISDRHLTTNTNWFVTTEKGKHGMNFGVRTPPIFDSWDDPTTKNAVFSVFQRHVSWFDSWRGVYGSTG